MRNDFWIYLRNSDDRREDRAYLYAVFRTRSVFKRDFRKPIDRTPDNLDCRCDKCLRDCDRPRGGCGITGMTGPEVARRCMRHVIPRRVQGASSRGAA